jgi:hypothetical protein
MATFKRSINTSILPDDILSYTDTQFYNVAKQIVGDSGMELLEIQSIRSPDSFLFMPDVFAILDIKCAALNSLKEDLRLKTDDDKYIVKPGIKSLMTYFRELTIKKQAEVMKVLRYKNDLSTSVIPSLTIISSTMNESSSSQQQQLPLSVTTNLVQPTTSIPVDENYHRNFIVNSINNWCEKFSSKVLLIEGTDYHLTIKSLNDNITAKIKCGCGSKVGLVKVRKNIQLSNFYKHLTSTACNTIHKSKRRATSNNSNKNQNNSNKNVDTSSKKSKFFILSKCTNVIF